MLGLALAVYQKELVILVVGDHLVEGAENLRGKDKWREVIRLKTLHFSQNPPLFVFSFLLLPHLLVLLALFSEGVASRLLQETNGNVVDLLLVEHGEGVRLPGTLG